MRRRLVLLVVAFLALVALAGCASLLGPGEPDPDRLTRNATYEWEDDVTVGILVNKTQYEAVYDVGNSTELKVYRRDALGRDQHVRIAAVQFRYENGTVVGTNDSSLSVTLRRSRTIVSLPNRTGNGSLAFTASRHGKTFATPVFVEGSYAVTLPPGARVGVPLLSQVRPGGYNGSVNDDTDRMTLTWRGDEERVGVTGGPVLIRYYLQRDLLIFGTLLAAAIVLAVGGGFYYYRQIQRLERRRKEAGIDLEEEETDDEFRDDGPPPGLR